MDREALKSLLAEATADAVAQGTRVDVCRALGVSFRDAGNLLWTGGSLIGPDRVAGDSPFAFGSDAVVGLGIVAQIAGELTAGAVTLLEEGNLYGAAALMRQIVEVEQLAWAFAEDHAQAAAWMRSTRDDRLAMWSPRQLRKRSKGRFKDHDYWGHCDRGGHPTPEATILLPNHSRQLAAEWWWFDLANHGMRAWNFVSAAAEQRDWGKQVSSLACARPLATAAERWLRTDRLLAVTRMTDVIHPLDEDEPS